MNTKNNIKDNGVRVWALPWPSLGMFVLGLGFVFGPKTPGVRSLVRNPSPYSFGTFMAGNRLPLHQVSVSGVVAHNTPTNYVIHSTMSLDEQCLFLAL